MFRRLKAAYGAGYRAGAFGTRIDNNPFNQHGEFLLAYFWRRGWLEGSKKRPSSYTYF